METTSNTKVPLSVIIPALNEAVDLPKAIRSVEWADEVYVVDSDSTDGTPQIAQTLGAIVVPFRFNGIWPKKYNWSLENLPLRNEWVLILDADEVMREGAREEIREIVAVNSRGYDGYYINRHFMFMGQRLRHCYYPNWDLRLFRRRLGRFERLTGGATDSGDIEVHEHLILKGRAGFLKTEMDHYAFPTIEDFVEKHNRYSNWEAHVEIDEMLSWDSIRALGPLRLKLKRLLRIAAHHLPFRGFLRFFFIYFIQGGFLDGKRGYYFARLHQFYEFLSVCKRFELKKKILLAGGQKSNEP